MQSKWYENAFLFWWRCNSLQQNGFALIFLLKVTVFGTWTWPIEQWAHDELHCGIPVKQNNSGPGFPGTAPWSYLKEFLVNNCSFSRLITKHDDVLLQFTTARLITIYDNVFITIYDGLVITILDNCYYNLRRLLLQFTTGTTIHERTHVT